MLKFVLGVALIYFKFSLGTFFLEEVIKCNPAASYGGKLQVTAYETYQSKQRIDFNITLSQNVDIYPATFMFELQDQNKWIKVFKMTEKSACIALNKYMGQVWHELQKLMGMVPTFCPIPVGSYHVEDYMLDFNKLLIRNMQKGKLKISLRIYDKKQDIFCYVFLVKNV